MGSLVVGVLGHLTPSPWRPLHLNVFVTRRSLEEVDQTVLWGVHLGPTDTPLTALPVDTWDIAARSSGLPFLFLDHPLSSFDLPADVINHFTPAVTFGGACMFVVKLPQ